MSAPVDVLAGIVADVDALDHGCAYDIGAPRDTEGWLRLGPLLAAPAGVAGMVERLLAGEATGHPDVAGSYLASWLTGPVVHLLAAAWLDGGRVLHVDLDDISVHLHDGGWVDALAIAGAHLTVGADDAAAQLPGVTVVEHRNERRRLAAEQVHAIARPVVDAVRACVPYGRSGMWGSLADGLAGGTLFAEQRRPRGGDPDAAWAGAVELLDELASRVPELRARPRRQLIPWSGGVRHQSVRGTCCLYYKTCADPDPRGDGYCSSCPHRPDDSRADRVSRWLEGQHA